MRAVTSAAAGAAAGTAIRGWNDLAVEADEQGLRMQIRACAPPSW
jgi:hypothetical protein